MSAFNPDLENLNILVLGSFNPTIFHPLWFKQHNLISNSDLIFTEEKSSVKLLHPQITQFTLSWCEIEIQTNRFLIQTTQEAYFEQLFDLAIGVFTLLQHTPITAVGINYLTNQSLDQADKFDFLNNFYSSKLKEIYRGFLPFNIQFTIQKDKESNINVQIKEDINSKKIVTNVNYHYECPEFNGSMLAKLISENGRKSLQICKDNTKQLFTI